MALHKETQVAPPSATEAVETGVAGQLSGEQGVEWTAGPMRPVAHWVTMPSGDGRSRLQMIWAVPNPVAQQAY